MKKLLALLVVGGLLALTTGCPPGTTSEEVKPKANPGGTPPAGSSGSGTHEAPPPVKGALKKVDGDKITVGDTKDIDIKGAIVTINGKDAKAADIKAADDTTATVTYDKSGKVAMVDVKTATPAPPPPPPAAAKVEGKAKSAAKDKVTITDKDGKDVDLAVTDDTKVSIDGKDGKAADIKKDSAVTATKDGDKVTKIEATSPAAPPPPPPPPPPAATKAEGKVKSAAKDKVTITDKDGKDWDLAVTDDTKVTIDGKDGKAADIKKDSAVTATKDGDKVTKIEATSPK